LREAISESRNGNEVGARNIIEQSASKMKSQKEAEKNYDKIQEQIRYLKEEYERSKTIQPEQDAAANP